MVASAQLLMSALSYPAGGVKPEFPDERDALLGVSDPDSGLDGCDLFVGHESPLTSEPPLADTAPLTAEIPISAELPLTSEPTANGFGAGAESMEV
ncbi:hypothetical protein [Streptomyces sp. H27-D2]|uniref:hypothetical protein n=1 Tax=Streptomyces sp. H27-D2 TaxID=3046304 RepID=UPI002DC02058|nr:hypothetical protein [Streptomyces sp. H27-D2]MEC4014893.1 hypothetical protein [Streptomyces sp. H27-D2]